MKVLTNLQKIANDVLKGKPVQFEGVTGDEAIRNAVLEAMGGTMSYQNYRANMPTVFAVIEELVEVTLGEVITNEFDNLAEVRNTEFGDKPSFKVEDNKLFRVARIGGGIGDIRRQRVTNGAFTVETGWYAVAIYTEFEQFMSGRVDFAEWIQRIATSFANHLGTQIYKAVVTAYPTLLAPYKAEGKLDEEAILTIVDHVESASGKKAVIYGSRRAIRKLSKDGLGQLSDGSKDKLNKAGFLDTFNGVPLYVLPNAHKVGTNEFLVDDNFLLVLPQGSKLVKVLLEGQPVMIEKNGTGDRTDLQIEHQLQKKIGVGIQQASIYGAYKITA